jgi:hypothetical protein
MTRLLSQLLLWLVATTSITSAQLLHSGDSGARALLPRDREIALARSAAPAAVSDSATIFVLTATGYQLVAEGHNGAACYVSRDWKISIEPHCFDREGAATIMRMHMRRVELLHAGRSMKEANDAIANGLLDGEFRVPSRPVMSWMMSSAQQLVSPDGRAVGAWKPHVMIYYPYLAAADVALASPGAAALSTMISDPASPFSNLVVVVPDFVEPRVLASERR